jgi:hypothetical protein
LFFWNDLIGPRASAGAGTRTRSSGRCRDLDGRGRLLISAVTPLPPTVLPLDGPANVSAAAAPLVSPVRFVIGRTPPPNEDWD